MIFAETGALNWFGSHSWWRSKHEDMSFILLFYRSFVLRYVVLEQSATMSQTLINFDGRARR